MGNILREIFLNHKEKISDKWSLYINEWDRIFNPYRDLPINLFEIGIQNGGSLEIWAKYFKNARKIVGCDIDDKCRGLSFTDPRIELYVGDVNTDEIQEKALESASKYDIIIDDGSHQSSDVIRTFSRYFPHLDFDGMYVVEDLHTSYWKGFGGGLYDPNSPISFFKHLTDILNHEHWRNNKSREEFLAEFASNYQVPFSETDLSSIHLIEFLNSLCIIKKSNPISNRLGNRIVVGRNELVTTEITKINGTSIHNSDVAISDDSDLDIWRLIKQNEEAKNVIEANSKEIDKLNDEMNRLEHECNNLVAANTELQETLSFAELERHNLVAANTKLQETLSFAEHEIVDYYSSTSWKITRPFRWIRKKLRGNNG